MRARRLNQAAMTTTPWWHRCRLMKSWRSSAASASWSLSGFCCGGEGSPRFASGKDSPDGQQSLAAEKAALTSRGALKEIIPPMSA